VAFLLVDCGRMTGRVVKRDQPLDGFRALGQLEVTYDLVAMWHTRGGSEALRGE
jgi:hypothetical protein